MTVVPENDRKDVSAGLESSERRVFVASDGYEHVWRCWLPSGPPRAVVVGLHGIQSHAGWYGASSVCLAAAGYAVAFLDRRGSGENAAFRGDAPHADRLVYDVVQFVEHLKRNGFDGVPIVMSAVSWGGKLAAVVAACRPDLIDGLVLLAPGLCPQVGANVLQRLALRFGDAAGSGRREVSIPLEDPALFTDVAEHQAFIRDDPLALRKVTVRFLTASLELDRRVRRHAASIGCPLLLMLAGRDRILDNAATRRLVVSFGSTEKTLMEYPGACHTLEFDRNRDAVVADLAAWLDHRLVSRRPRSTHARQTGRLTRSSQETSP